jgi:hypothetical protein
MSLSVSVIYWQQFLRNWLPVIQLVVGALQSSTKTSLGAFGATKTKVGVR